MKRIYIAGAFSADNVLDVLKNIGRGERKAAELFSLGFAPFCPWHDKDFIIKNPDFDFTIDMFYEYSIAWLEVSDCLLLVPGWERSKGVAAELKRAGELGMPIFTNVREIQDFYENNKM